MNAMPGDKATSFSLVLYFICSAEKFPFMINVWISSFLSRHKSWHQCGLILNTYRDILPSSQQGGSGLAADIQGKILPWSHHQLSPLLDVRVHSSSYSSGHAIGVMLSIIACIDSMTVSGHDIESEAKTDLLEHDEGTCYLSCFAALNKTAVLLSCTPSCLPKNHLTLQM